MGVLSSTFLKKKLFFFRGAAGVFIFIVLTNLFAL